MRLKADKRHLDALLVNPSNVAPITSVYTYPLMVDFRTPYGSFKGSLYVQLSDWFETFFNENQPVYTVNSTAFTLKLIYEHSDNRDEYLLPLLILSHKESGNEYRFTVSSAKAIHTLKTYAPFMAELPDGLNVWEPYLDAPKDTTITVDIAQELLKLTAEGHYIHLPKESVCQLESYSAIRTLMLRAGGLYVPNNSFVFEGCAESVLNRLQRGEVVNDKAKYQIYESTHKVVALAKQKLALQPHETWFEPSAGRARLANMMREISPNGVVCEIFEPNIASLKAQGYEPIEGDFMTVTGEMTGLFDKICTNPPFTANQDVTHVRKCYDQHLKEGGRMVAVMSTSWIKGKLRIQQDFRAFLDSVGAEWEALPEGCFKESGTNVKTVMVTINKPNIESNAA